MNEVQESSVDAFASLINGATLTCRTGILLLPLRKLGQERNLAVDFAADFIDYIEWRLARMQDTNFLSLTADTLADDLSTLSQRVGGKRSAIVANLDIALSYLPFEEHEIVWRYLREHMRRRPTGLVIALPESADTILPSGNERELWLEGKRLIALP